MLEYIQVYKGTEYTAITGRAPRDCYVAVRGWHDTTNEDWIVRESLLYDLAQRVAHIITSEGNTRKLTSDCSQQGLCRIVYDGPKDTLVRRNIVHGDIESLKETMLTRLEHLSAGERIAFETKILELLTK